MDEVGRQVAYNYIFGERKLVGKTAAKNKSFARECVAIGKLIQIKRNGIIGASIVTEAKRVGRDGDVFALAVPSSRRFPIVSDAAWPQNVAFTVNHASYQWANVLIGAHRNAGGKIFVCVD